MVGVTKVELRKMLKELLRPGDPSLKDNKDWSGKQYAVNVCKMLSKTAACSCALGTGAVLQLLNPDIELVGKSD